MPQKKPQRRRQADNSAVTQARSTIDELNSAIQFHRAGELEQAESLYRAVLQREPHNANALHLLGVIAQQCHRLDIALALLNEAVKHAPRFADAHNNLGMVHHDLGHHAEAITHYQTAIDLNPRLPEAYTNLGGIFHESGNLALALANYRKALDLQPNLASAHNNIGVVLFDQGSYEEALRSYSVALHLEPQFADSYNNRGNALRHLANYDDALQAFNTAVQLQPDSAGPRWNRSLVHLARGHFAQGWKDYEWGFNNGERLARDLPYPTWDGSSLEGKTLLIYAEQGIGDEIFFSSCFHDAATRAERIIIDCDPRLVALFKRSFPHAIVHGGNKHDNTTWTEQHKPIHWVIAEGSLPRFFRPAIESIPAILGFLSPDAAKVSMWRRRLVELGEGLKVGISWRGGSSNQTKIERSTALKQWIPVLTLPNLRLINLQYGDCQNELNEIETLTGVTIMDWEDADPLHDLDNFVAQVAELDLVITVDNSTAHFAGAVGTRVWTLVPVAPDWRWMAIGNKTPWYPSATVFRQRKPGEWQSVFQQVTQAIVELANRSKLS